MKSEVYICDECQAQKKDANRWWLMKIMTTSGEFVLSEWMEEGAEQPNVKHLCGRACVILAVSKYMEQPGVSL